MDALAGNVAERAIDHALPLEPPFAHEGDAFDHDREMRFAAAVVTGMAMVAGAVVDDVEPRREEGLLQQDFDLARDRSAHGLIPGVFMRRAYHHSNRMRAHKFHGRYDDAARDCDSLGCREPGEFRAPGARAPSSDGPGDWRWFCLEHVRAFNSGYDWFEGMSAEEILMAQSPLAGWHAETRAFRPDGGMHGVPRWADFDDPLDAIGARAADIRQRAGRQDHFRFTAREREALGVMGLDPQTDRTALRRRYSVLVRRYHPDRNGGDRSHEARLQRVVEAYQLLRRAAAFE